MKGDLSILIIKPEAISRVEEVLECLRDYKVIRMKELRWVNIIPSLYEGNPTAKYQQEFYSRRFGPDCKAIALLLEHKRGDTAEKIKRICGPTSPMEYTKPEHKLTLRHRFGLEAIIKLGGLEIYLNAVHAPDPKNANREIKLLFGENGGAEED
jgi:nucleoside diphosphate kinase